MWNQKVIRNESKAASNLKNLLLRVSSRNKSSGNFERSPKFPRRLPRWNTLLRTCNYVGYLVTDFPSPFVWESVLDTEFWRDCKSRFQLFDFNSRGQPWKRDRLETRRDESRGISHAARGRSRGFRAFALTDDTEVKTEGVSCFRIKSSALACSLKRVCALRCTMNAWRVSIGGHEAERNASRTNRS